MLPRLAIWSVLLFAGCKESSERTLLGTWRVEGPDTNNATWTYHADHTLDFTGFDAESQPLLEHGTWKLSGDQLTQTVSASTAKPTIPAFTSTIVKLTSDKLALRSSGETVIVMQRIQ